MWESCLYVHPVALMTVHYLNYTSLWHKKACLHTRPKLTLIVSIFYSRLFLRMCLKVYLMSISSIPTSFPSFYTFYIWCVTVTTTLSVSFSCLDPICFWCGTSWTSHQSRSMSTTAFSQSPSRQLRTLINQSNLTTVQITLFNLCSITFIAVFHIYGWKDILMYFLISSVTH